MSTSDKVNILMVDDNPGKLLTYEAILAGLGENLIPANSGSEALESLLKHDIGVILMDVGMPDMDGFEVAEIIRQHPRFERLAIIFISAIHLSDLDRLKGYERGAVDYISVPVVPEVLRAKVAVFADLHRKTQQLELLNRDLERRVRERTEKLWETEGQFKTLANSIPQLAWMSTPDGSRYWYNQRWYSYTGTSYEDMRTCGWLKYYHPSHVERVCGGLQRSQATGEEWEDTHPILGQDGRYRWFLSRAVPVRDSQKRIARWFATATDVTSQIEVEERIKTLNRNLEQQIDILRERAELMDLASEAIMVRDRAGLVQYWNSGAEHLYGWKRDEIIGRHMHHTLQTVFPVPVQGIQDVIATTGRWEGHLTQRTKNGTEITVACRNALKTEESGSGTILEINRDITGELRMQEVLQQTEKLAAMGRVAGMIAHQINNPLEAVMNAVFLLRNNPSLDKEARDLVRMANEELRRVAHITRQTLSLHRESEQPVPVAVTEILEDVLSFHRESLRKSGVTPQLKMRTRHAILGLPGELRQVFLNLVENAIQSMPKGGRLRVHVHESTEHQGLRKGVRISICDTGTGIRRQDGEKIFEPFFTTKSTKGTGLGLWISRGIAHKYEGTIRFRTLRCGRRNVTCFSVFLPGSQAPDDVLPFQTSASPDQLPLWESVAS